jgi:ABC transporter transmembrane region
MTFSKAREGYLKYFLRYKWRVVITYLTTMVGGGCVALYPYVTGLAIDGALRRDAMALVPLVAIWLLHLAIDGFRQVFDTRTFARIISEAAADLVVSQKALGKGTSQVSARVNMMEELTWFLGTSVPDILIFIIPPIGALTVLFALSPAAAWASLAIAFASILFNIWLFPFFKRRQEKLNGLTELSVNCIEVGSQDRVLDHYQNVGKANVSLSDLSAQSWMSVQAVGIVVLAFAVWNVGASSSVTPGIAYTTVSYVWSVLEAAFVMSGYTFHFARLSDIWRRINETA